jgi:filamentous hemagglutinin
MSIPPARRGRKRREFFDLRLWRGDRKAGGTVLKEAKSSATAPLTKAQQAAHPEIAQKGATVAGKNKPGYPGGTKIPPTNVQVVRPPRPAKTPDL